MLALCIYGEKFLQAPVKLVLCSTFKGEPLSLHYLCQAQQDHDNMTPAYRIARVCRPSEDEKFELGLKIINGSRNNNSES